MIVQNIKFLYFSLIFMHILYFVYKHILYFVYKQCVSKEIVILV